ncbi:MAG: vWA domain-containing protein [Polyangiales bacterium]
MRPIKWWLASLCMVAACGSDEGPSIGELTGSGDPSSVARDGGAGSGSKDGGIGGGGASGGSECTKRTVQPEKTTPDMLVVLDRSGSMIKNDQGTNRWAGSVEAVTEVVQTYDDRVSFGLMTFPSVNTGNSCAAGSMNVPVGPGAGSQIASALSRMNAEGFTPTAATLQAVRKTFEAGIAADTVVAPKFVLLVTDGDPNCSSSWIPNNGSGQSDPEARQQTIAAIQALNNDGVRTYVVGYQTAGTGFSQQLDMMAAAGGTGAKTHRSVDSGSDLQIAIEEIASRAVSCSYKLDKAVSDPSYVLVQVKGKTRAYGNGADGWALGPDMQTITLTGAACDAVQDGAGFTVEVVCSPVTVI